MWPSNKNNCNKKHKKLLKAKKSDPRSRVLTKNKYISTV